MPGQGNALLAGAVLAVHVVVIVFNVVGLVAVPVGAWLGWRWVRVRWWRALHLAALAAVAGQALMGRVCFLTVWQASLLGPGASRAPLVMRWVNRVIYWNVPIWVFAALYAAVFLYAVALWWLVPPRPRRAGTRPRPVG